MVAPTRTSLTPPRLASLPAEREQLEFSSRSLVFATDGRRLLRAWGPADASWVVAVEPDGDRWRIEAWGATPTMARAAVRRLFSLDHPLEAFYQLVRREPVLRGTERRFRGLRVPRDANLYESLFHSILGQQLSVAATNAMKRRLFEKACSSIEVEGIEVPAVPSPARLGAIGLDGVRSVGLSRAKAEFLVALARWAAVPQAPPGFDGPIALAISRLSELPGVGRWTAENALLRGVGRRDVFVAGDLGIRVALDRYGAVPRRAPETRARAWAERHYPDWGSYATLYLWRKLVADRTVATGG